MVVIDRTPLGDPMLDPALLIVSEGAQKPVDAIGKLGKGLRESLYTALEKRGILP